MVAIEPITEMALAIVFGACVPAVSGGAIKQTVPSEKFAQLSQSEMNEYGVNDAEAAFRIVTDVGLIIVAQKDGYCRVIIGEGDPVEARERFKQLLSERGGYIPTEKGLQETPDTTVGKIDLGHNEYIAISFTAGSDAGFFASSFRMKQ